MTKRLGPKTGEHIFRRSSYYFFRHLVLVVSVVALVGCSAVSTETKQLLGRPAPETRLVVAGKAPGTDYVALSTYRGKTLVLGFWDTQCPNSRQMVGELNEYARSFFNRSDLAFIAVSIDPIEAEDTWKREIAERKLDHLEHAFSGNGPLDEAFLMFRLFAIPVIIVIDPSGIVEAVSDSTSVVEQVLIKK